MQVHVYNGRNLIVVFSGKRMLFVYPRHPLGKASILYPVHVLQYTIVYCFLAIACIFCPQANFLENLQCAVVCF